MVLYSICLFLTSLSIAFHPHCCKWQLFILFYGWVIFHCISIHLLKPNVCLFFFKNLSLFYDYARSLSSFPGGSMVKNLPSQARDAGDSGSIPGSGRGIPSEEEMATHSRILAWKIPWTEEPHGLLSMGLQKVKHDWATEHAHTGLRCCSELGLLYLRCKGLVVPQLVGSSCTRDWTQVLILAGGFLITGPREKSLNVGWWALELVPCLGYCKQCCCAPWGVCIFSN